MKKVVIFGSGYVGLVTGACLAEVGHHVVCVDTDEEKVTMLKRGKSPIYEPGLEEILARTIEQGTLTFTTNAGEAIKDSEIVMSAVGTPPGEGGEADLKYVRQVARTIAKHMDGYRIIVTKSTVPTGTGEEVEGLIEDELAERNVEYHCDVVSNPEFLKEGSAVQDFLNPDRIIVGTDSERAREAMRKLYKPLMLQSDRLVFMDRLSAELTKYAANSILATKISFMNELSQIADKLGANIENVRLGIGSDPRIGRQFLYPGIGYGGSCFPKDVSALEKQAQSLGIKTPVLTAAEEANARQPEYFAQKILSFYNHNLSGKTFALWGLAFKENTDDVRATRVAIVCKKLLAAGAKIHAYDPEGMENFREQIEVAKHENISYVKHADDALEDADALLVLTPWKQFRAPDFEMLKATLHAPVIFDGRNLYNPEDLKKLGFTYISVGRPDVM